jgi:subtilase family serine protease
VLIRISVAFVLFFCLASAFGQPSAPNTQLPSGISGDSTLVRMRGHVPAFTRGALDLGPLEADALLTNVVVLLSRTSEQEQELEEFLRGLQDPASQIYRQWLSPEEFGERFGARDSDIQTVTAWLCSYGLKVTASRSKTFIEVEGNAAQVSAVFHTEFHSFDLNGHTVYSIVEEPRLPSAIRPLVKSISGLSQTLDSPEYSSPSQDQSNSRTHSEETLTNGNHIIAPGDFATIFDVNRAYSAGYNGAGRTIAIVGRSRVNNADIENFAAYTNLSLRDPIVVLPPGSVDPGQTGDTNQGEATLDVERASSVAAGATVSLVIDAQSNGGIGRPLRYVIDNKAADIMTMSFGACELNASESNVDFYSALFSQGAAEGITTFVSSGDSGAAACDAHNMPAPATQAASINFYCASPDVTCVGGTQLNDSATPSIYWSTTNSTNRASAFGYIPEGAFNVPVAGNGTFQIFAGGGGSSMYITKPSWQAGLNVPQDGHRDVPDIAFPSSSHDGYLFCYTPSGFPCVPNAQGVTFVTSTAGTSAAAPSMAGIQALIDQAEGGPVGNINPRIYALASSMAGSVFHDVTVASSGVTNCTLDVPSLCNNSTPSTNALTGGLPGYSVGPGYDLVTGWGSLDVYNLLISWSSAPSLAQPTVNLVLPETVISTAQSIKFSVSITGTGPTPTGTVQFVVDGNPLQRPVSLNSGVATSQPYMTGLIQVHNVAAVYSGDAYYAPASSATLPFTVNTPVAPVFTVSATPISILAAGASGTSTITVSPLNGFNGTVSFTCAGFGGFSAASCNFTPSTLNVNGSPGSVTLSLTAAKPSLKRISVEQHYSPVFRSDEPLSWGKAVLALLCFCVTRRGRGRRGYSLLMFVLLAAGLGFNTGCSRTSPTITITSAVNPATTGEPVTFTAAMAAGSDTAPTGKVQFLSNGVTIGKAQALTNGVATLSQTFTTAGSFAITAQYFGSSSYATALSTPLTETVGYKNPGAVPGTYTILVEATSGSLSQTVPVQVTVQ